jgi:hypothetical protein
MGTEETDGLLEVEITEDDLLALLSAAQEHPGDVRGMTSAEIAACWGVSQKTALLRLRPLIEARKIYPAKLWRMTIQGDMQRRAGYVAREIKSP